MIMIVFLSIATVVCPCDTDEQYVPIALYKDLV